MQLKSINEIFTNRIFRIPSYQRGYSWANDRMVQVEKPEEFNKVKGQLMDLWNDIINIPEGKWHYTGLLTLVKPTNYDYNWLQNHKQYSIVDGQQRITSILILITVLTEEAERLGIELGIREGDTRFQYLYIQKSGVNAYIFGYNHDNPSDKFFRKHILGLNEVEDDSSESVYTENLKNAKAFFRCVVKDRIGNGDDQSERLIQLFVRVTRDLRLNEYVLPNDLDEYVVFETMNNRGKPLTDLEKLKNRLMYLADKFEAKGSNEEETKSLTLALKKDLVKTINNGWTTVYQALGAKKEDLLDDDDFIKNHWIAYFDRYSRAEANAYSNYLFNEHFVLQHIYDGLLEVDDIRNYVKSLQQSSILWLKMHHTSFFDSDETPYKDAVMSLHRVGFRVSFKPIVLAILQRKDQADFLKVLHLLEEYAFKVFHVADRQSNTGDSKLYKLASGIYHGRISFDDAYSEIENHMKYYYSFSLFNSQIRELFETGDKNGYYDWSGIYYFLYIYDWSLRKENRTTTRASELIWEDFVNKNTIEHIYPQSAAKSKEEFCNGDDSKNRLAIYEKNQNCWPAFSIYTPEQKKRLCNSLGNLLAISNCDNASFQNDPFKFKVDQSQKGDDYKNRGYRYDSISAQLVAKEDDWTPENILERGIKMIDALLDHLVEPRTGLFRDEKIELLGLSFMVESNNLKEDYHD